MKWLTRLFAKPSAKEPDTKLVYVRIPGEVWPVDRGDRFEDPLDEMLRQAKLGLVSGGGSSLGPEAEDGSRVVVFAGIDVDAYDLDGTRGLLRAQLPLLGAPVGTQIEYSVADERLQDRLNHDGWSLAGPRTDLHPGFGL